MGVADGSGDKVGVGAVVGDGGMVAVMVGDGTCVLVAGIVAELVAEAVAVLSKVGRSVCVGGGGVSLAVSDGLLATLSVKAAAR